MMQKTVWLSVILGFFGAATGAFADSESDGAAAEKAGRYREALNYYVAALQSVPEGSAKVWELRERIITAALALKPPPAVPTEARRHLARAQGAIELAKQPEDMKLAVAELEKALRLASWWAEGYYNLGVVQDKAGRYGDAVRSLRLYLRAAPGAKDAQDVEMQIAKLEFKAEQSSPAARATREKQEFKTPDYTKLGGNWRAFQYIAHARDVMVRPTRRSPWNTNSANGQAQVRIIGNSFRATFFPSFGGSLVELDGQFVNGVLSGIYMYKNKDDSDCPVDQKFPFHGEFDLDEPSIVLIVKGSYAYRGNRGCPLIHDGYWHSLLLLR